MLVRITKQKSEEEVVELKLPAFYMSATSNKLFMITEDQTIIELCFYSTGCAHILTTTKTGFNHKSAINQVLSSESTSPYVFFKAWHEALDTLESKIRTPLFVNPAL